jgi:hypothetical protein
MAQQAAEATRGAAARALQQPAPEREKSAVDAAAQVIVRVRLEHRQDIRKARGIVGALMAELESVVSDPALYGRVHMALALGAKAGEGSVVALRRMVELVESLPQRAKVAGNLAEALGRLIGLEREAYGLQTGDGSGRAVVIIKDYTGKGAVEAPPLVQGEDGTYGLDDGQGAAQPLGGVSR